MPTFHVFIDRAKDAGGAGQQALAAAVAERYGLPAAQIEQRLAAGKMRVKTGVDLATAETFADDLESLGAVCSIVDAESGAPVSRAKAPVAPPPRPTKPPPMGALPPKPAAPAPASPAASGQFQSGLAAAFSGQSSDADLGALGSGELSLSALDGSDERAAPSGDALPASFGPPAETKPTPAKGKETERHAPMDLFAPPDAEGEPELDVAVDVRAGRRGGTTAPPQTHAAASSVSTTPAGRAGRQSAQFAAEMAAPPTPVAKVSLGERIADARVRLAAGVVLAILLGFIPAHFIASSREGVYAEINAEVTLHQQKQVVDLDDYKALDGYRAKQQSRKEEKQRDIALISLIVWAAVGGGFAFVWFRVIDWDKLSARLTPAA